MNITIYTNKSDPRVLNKGLVQIASLNNVKLTDACDILNPSFKLNYNSNYVNANYLYVQEWNKYYFINDKTILNGAEMQIDCHIDVLMTYKNSILNSECIANRSSSKIDDYIVDEVCPDKGTTQTKTYRASMSPFQNTGSYVLCLAGRSSSSQ